MSYQLVAPKDYTEQHKKLIDSYREAIAAVPAEAELFFDFKDVDSRFIAATDFAGRLWGLKKGQDAIGRLDRELPCEGVVQFADDFVREDLEVLNSNDLSKNIMILDLIHYCCGRKLLLTSKSLLKHDESQSKLGVRCLSMEVKFSDFLSLLPNYYAEFGPGGSITRETESIALENAKLTPYEHEVCFLLTLNWSHKQIAEFMNKYRPTSAPRVADTIHKCINRIHEKLNIQHCYDDSFRELLVHLGVHKRMPQAFFDRLIGTHVLH